MFALAKQASLRIARKVGRDSAERSLCATKDARGALWIMTFEFCETFAETSGVELVNGKCADAALRATGTTDQEVAAAAGCVIESGV
jgi:hypothetical protein